MFMPSTYQKYVSIIPVSSSLLKSYKHIWGCKVNAYSACGLTANYKETQLICSSAVLAHRP